MIYLIDDKRSRQNEFGWDSNRFLRYSSLIKTFYSYDEIKSSNSQIDIFKNGNVVLLHESFFDIAENKRNIESSDIKRKLFLYAEKHNDFKVVIFSGSKSNRKIIKNVGFLPVSELYKNLDVFLKNDDNILLQYLFFGENFDIEEKLLKKLNVCNNEIDDSKISDTNSNNFIALTVSDPIEMPFIYGTGETIFEEDISDVVLNNYVLEWFNDKEYDNLFIPLCFGDTLSDYNGLQFATHIRCTPTKNQTKNIFIYSFLSFQDIIEHEYFDILKTKNIFLIQYNFPAFKEAIDKKLPVLSKEDLYKEICKINLNVPKNYYDSHSLINEWSIFRWANALNIEEELIEELGEIKSNINDSLYYKYLSVLYPISPISKIRNKILLNKGSVLLIDDEVTLGWDLIFKTICKNIKYKSIGENFKELKKQEAIIEEAFNAAKEADVIILDLRLNEEDFNQKNPKELTGYKLLEKIKNYNKGIQVIIFSATNKIQNLQELQEIGIDGFIVKESPEHSINAKITGRLIENIYKTIDSCLEYSFVKGNYEKFYLLKEQLVPRINYDKADKPLPKKFVNEYLRWLEFGIINILKYKSNEGNILSFSIFFIVLENITSRIIDTENACFVGNGSCKFEFRKKKVYLKEFKRHSGKYVKTSSDLICKTKNINWNQKILNTLDELSCTLPDINMLIEKRNDIIHSNTTTTTGKSIDISLDELKKIFRVVTENIESIQ